MALEKAKLYPVSGPLDNPVIDRDNEFTVQFNPTTLKVSLANSLKENERDQTTRASQYIEKSSSSLTVELIFDSSDIYIEFGEGAAAKTYDIDVRYDTGMIASLFLYSEKVGDKKAEPQRCMFAWGSFIFVGIMESMEETIDFFSPEGVPLRSTVALKIVESRFYFETAEAKATKKSTPTLSNAPSSVDNAVAQNGSTISSTNASSDSQNQRATAMYNGVESPRNTGTDNLSVPSPGAMENLKNATTAGLDQANAAVKKSGFGANLGESFTAGAGGGFGIGGGLSAGISGGVSGGLSIGASAGASAGFGINASLSAGISASVSSNLKLSTSTKGSSTGFSFGASSSLGTSIPGAFSADFDSCSGITAGSLVSGGIALREESSFSSSATVNTETTTTSFKVSAKAELGFD